MFHLGFTKLCGLTVGPSEVFKNVMLVWIVLDRINVTKQSRTDRSCFQIWTFCWFADVSDFQGEALNLISSSFQLAEYRQRKAYADSQKKQKKKKKKKSGEDSEGDSRERGEVEPQHCVGGEESSGGGRDGSQEGNKDAPNSEFTFTRMLQGGETVEHRQNYSVEVGG